MTELVLREAAPDDLDELIDVVTAAYRGNDDRGWTTEADLLDGQRTDAEEVGSAMADPFTRLIVAERDGSIVGCIKVDRPDPSFGDDAEVAHFGLFAVDPRRQSGGTGGALLDEAERVASEEWGCTAMELEVLRQREDLAAWYRRRGYGPTGETQPFPYGDERFGLPRVDDLVFEVMRRRLP